MQHWALLSDFTRLLSKTGLLLNAVGPCSHQIIPVEGSIRERDPKTSVSAIIFDIHLVPVLITTVVNIGDFDPKLVFRAK
jgi:hypothetical protein